MSIDGRVETSKRHHFFKERLKKMGLYEKESDYEGKIGKWVEEISEVIAKQGHSGMSVAVTMGVLIQLMNEWIAE